MVVLAQQGLLSLFTFASWPRNPDKLYVKGSQDFAVLLVLSSFSVLRLEVFRIVLSDCLVTALVSKALRIPCHRTLAATQHSGPGIFSGYRLPQAEF